MIREAHEHELDDVAALIAAAYREYEHEMPPAVWAIYEADMTAVRSRLAASMLIVAESDGDLTATATYYGPGHAGPVPSEWSYMRLLAVAPSARGSGTGRALVQDTIERARSDGAAAVGIHTVAFMTAAVKLYRSLGFERAPEHDMVAELPEPEPFKLRVEAYRLALDGGGPPSA